MTYASILHVNTQLLVNRQIAHYLLINLQQNIAYVVSMKHNL